jgi:serine/threonine protein kinase
LRPFKIQKNLYNNNPQQTFNKEVKLDRGTIFSIEREIETLKAVGEYKGHYFSEDNKVVIISTPFDASWQTLESHNTAIQPAEIINITKQICVNLKKLNDKGFLHNDLHKGNIMVRHKNNEIEARLIDYDRAIKIGEYTNDQGDQFDPPPVIPNDYLHDESTLSLLLKETATYTNKTQEAINLFQELKTTINSGNHELLRDTIIDHYLLPNPAPAKAKSSSIASLSGQDIIIIDNKAAQSTTKLIQQQYMFRKKLRTDITNNISSKTFIIYPYKNFFGIKSNSLQNVIMIDEQGNTTNLIHNKNNQKFYTKTFFSKQEFDLTSCLKTRTTDYKPTPAHTLEKKIVHVSKDKKHNNHSRPSKDKTSLPTLNNQ